MPHATRHVIKRIAAELAAFGAIGAVCLVADILLFNLLAFALGLPLLLAKSIGMVITGTMSYFGHRHVTFRHREAANQAHEIPVFVLVTVLSVALSLLPLYVLRHAVGTTSVLWLNVANLTGIALGTIARYVSYRGLVWSDPRTPKDAGSRSGTGLVDGHAAGDDTRGLRVLEVDDELVRE